VRNWSEMSKTRDAVMRLAYEQPDWIPVLRAACAQAEKTEPYGGQFAGRWVLQELQQRTKRPEWRPGLRLLVAYGLLEKVGESTRGGRRAYYRMPDRAEVEQALEELPI
jgi:hypothetical protein